MFSLEDLEPYFGEKMHIDGMTLTLTKVEELSGVLALWVGESYIIIATPYFDDVPVPVEVIDSNNEPIGEDTYYVEIDDFEMHTTVVKTLVAKLIRSMRMWGSCLR
jgi:hypothetical protein